VVVRERAGGLIAAFPFNTIELVVKTLPKLTPPPQLEPMVYAAVATLLLKKPLSVAMAFSVSVPLTVIGPLYTVELVVGVDPFVV